MDMNFVAGHLAGVCIITPKTFDDERGFFMEAYNLKDFQAHGLADDFKQDNYSFSRRNVLRGLHFQSSPHQVSKLVRCVEGEIYDVVVDLRPGSATFGKWEGFALSQNNKQAIYVPRGFAHGFCVTGEYAGVMYKVDDYYYPDCDRGIKWNDPTLNIKWPVTDPMVSAKDANLPLLSEVFGKQ